MILKIKELSKLLEKAYHHNQYLVQRIKALQACFEEEKRNIKITLEYDLMQQFEQKMKSLQKMFMSETKNIIILVSCLSYILKAQSKYHFIVR